MIMTRRFKFRGHVPHRASNVQVSVVVVYRILLVNRKWARPFQEKLLLRGVLGGCLCVDLGIVPLRKIYVRVRVPQPGGRNNCQFGDPWNPHISGRRKKKKNEALFKSKLDGFFTVHSVFFSFFCKFMLFFFLAAQGFPSRFPKQSRQSVLSCPRRGSGGTLRTV